MFIDRYNEFPKEMTAFYIYASTTIIYLCKYDHVDIKIKKSYI